MLAFSYRPQLSKLGNDARELCEMVGSTCALAENISSKVRELDLAKVSESWGDVYVCVCVCICCVRVRVCICVCFVCMFVGFVLREVKESLRYAEFMILLEREMVAKCLQQHQRQSQQQ